MMIEVEIAEMETETENESIDTMLTLDVSTSAAAIARDCREAAMEFMNDSHRWSKAELGMWLTARYSMVTKHASKDAGGATWPVPLLRDIDARLIERIMQSARSEILETLRSISKDGSASFVLRALIAGTVIRCEDAGGQPAWAPTGDVPRLADRVLSLFAVDYLARPGDYETQLAVCAQCGSISFDEDLRTRAACEEHATSHSLTAPRPRYTLPYPPQPPLGA
jgi:hypothetical protein